jgi:hypothetical protein
MEVGEFSQLGGQWLVFGVLDTRHAGNTSFTSGGEIQLVRIGLIIILGENIVARNVGAGSSNIDGNIELGHAGRCENSGDIIVTRPLNYEEGLPDVEVLLSAEDDDLLESVKARSRVALTLGTAAGDVTEDWVLVDATAVRTEIARAPEIGKHAREQQHGIGGLVGNGKVRRDAWQVRTWNSLGEKVPGVSHAHEYI